MTDVATLFAEIITQTITQVITDAPAVATYDGSEVVIVMQDGAIKKDAAAGASAAAAAAAAAQAHDYAVTAGNAFAVENVGTAITAWLVSLPTTIPPTPGLPYLDNGVLSVSQ